MFYIMAIICNSLALACGVAALALAWSVRRDEKKARKED